MKKTLSLILALCMCLTVVASITGCDSETDNPQHTHTYETSWSYDEEYHWHSCEDDSCSDVSQKSAHSFENGICICGYKKETPTHTHTFKTEWSYNDTHHWYACEDDGCSEASQRATHAFVNGVCVCGYEEEALSHTHIFKTEWSYDETHHWHICEDEDCGEISNKTEHTWNDGEITVEPTKKSDGVKTYSCTDCKQTKTETVKYTAKTTVTTEEWKSAFDNNSFTNVTVSLSMDEGIYYLVSSTGTVILLDGYYQELGDNYFLRVYLEKSGDCGFVEERDYDGTLTRIYEEKETLLLLQEAGYVNIRGLGWYLFSQSDWLLPDFSNCFSLFSYDAVNNVYVANNILSERIKINDAVSSDPVEYEYVKVKFENGKLIRLELKMTDGDAWVLEYTDYGTTVINKDGEQNIHTYKPNWLYDDTHHWHSCTVAGCSEIFEKTTHSFVNSVCACGYEEETPTHSHTFETIWSHDDEYHWYACEDDNCSEVSGKATHSFTNGFCACGYEEEVPAHTHTPKAAVRENEILGTCMKDGSYDEIVYCSDCAEEISRTTHNTGRGDHLPAETVIENENEGNCLTDHTYDEVVYCSVCTETLSRIQRNDGRGAHKYIDNICTYCREQKYKPSDGLDFTLNSDNVSYSVTGIGACKETDVVIPSNYNGLPVTSIGDWAFNDCKNITSIRIPDSVTKIGEAAFHYCPSLTSITISQNVMEIGHSAFGNCYRLFEVINESSLNIQIGEESYGNIAYHAIEVHNGESKIINNNGYLFYTYNNVNYLLGYVGNDTELVLPDSFKGESYEIYMRAFAHCSNITSITIPDSVTRIGTSAFDGCSNLTSVFIGNGVKDIEYATFLNCTNLTNIVIPESVTTIGCSAFQGCSGLNNITIAQGVTTIGEFAFSDCYNLACVIIPDSVTNIGDYAFYYCRSLESITILDNVTSLGSSAFDHCSKLTSVTIGDGITEIKAATFRNCSNLTSVSFGKNISSIGSSAFKYCSNLKYLVIPDGVLSIGDGAFNSCVSLNVTIPSSVTRIGKDAFYCMNGLPSATFGNTDGWWYSSTADATSGTSISFAKLSDPDTAGDYLGKTYSGYYWFRE